MLALNKNDIIHELGKLRNVSNPRWNPPAEWIETNGLGGWSSSGVIGCHTRSYHGLLVAATKWPGERFNLLSKLEETIVIDNEHFELTCNVYSSNVIHPNGYTYIHSFTKELFPQWIYEIILPPFSIPAKVIKLKKTVAMINGENTILVEYEVLAAPSAFSLQLVPLISAKPNHTSQRAYNNIWWDVEFGNGTFHNKPFESAPDIYISIPGSSYYHDPKWFYNFNYLVDKYRGQEFEEDLFNHGTISIPLKEGDCIGVIISTEDPEGRNALELFEKEKNRRLSLLQPLSLTNDQPTNLSTVQLLRLAADQFIVRREEDLKTVIAGYHWFIDWSRDTMISLPGLCLSTGRFDDARKILAAFAKTVSMGMLPNRFQDNNEPPEYNTVDGTLWFFVAVKKYLDATADETFVLSEILPVMKEIIDWHFKGTRYNIHVDEDGLLYAGENGQQLTWMDVRIADWVVTPRAGKPVEIQALWYNALKIFAEMLRRNNQEGDATLTELSAARAKQSFTEKYWNRIGGYLFDNIDEHGAPDSSVRPNQLFALGLCFPVLDDPEKVKSILKIAEEKLYTPVGLRSLSPDDKRYVSIYAGNQFKRDSSYHQGTVWSWLLGIYVDGIMSEQGFFGSDGFAAKEKVLKILHDFLYHLSEGGIGSVSEIFDGDAPHHPRGCVAQAWGVAEILRVIADYRLA
jgi:predicted glycogen debranching enzyme